MPDARVHPLMFCPGLFSCRFSVHFAALFVVVCGLSLVNSPLADAEVCLYFMRCFSTPPRERVPLHFQQK